MARVTAHFDTAEFACRDGTAAPPGYIHKVRGLCRDYLEPLRSEFGPVTIVSGFRTRSHNRHVGGAPSSYHLQVAGRAGAGVDVVCARGTPRQWHEFLDRLGVPGLGFYSDHVHADNRLRLARW